MSPKQYQNLSNFVDQNLFNNIDETLVNNKTMVFLIPVPIAHLDYKKRAEKWFKFLYKNQFRKSINDDGLDHWDHENHKEEQKKLLDLIVKFGKKHQPKYIAIISGDVHSAGAASIKTRDNLNINQLISSAMVNHPPGLLIRLLMLFLSNKQSQIDQYELSLQRFGSNWKKTIYSRNFGFLYKAKGKGLKAYLRLEDNPDGYDFKQLAKFKNSDTRK